MSQRRNERATPRNTSWDPVAEWYQGMVGENGHKFHRRVAIPALLDLLEPQSGEHVLDIGCGPGALSPYLHERGVRYTGVDASERLLQAAREQHRDHGQFLRGDSRNLAALRELKAGMFDGATFLLSIQDMDPLREVFDSAAWAVKPGGRVVIVMTHPCFRIPRQSGWGWDDGRKLRFRRIDRYLTSLPVPMKPYPGQNGVTRSFHRPLHEYINGMARVGLAVERMLELPTFEEHRGEAGRADTLADQEIPLFLGLRAVKLV